jgi:LysR family hydrogen peroxide-inducible transcriptional activator
MWRARRILIEVQEICDLSIAARTQHGLLGTIRLGTSPTLGPYILPQIVKRLHREYPDLTLYVREGMPRDLHTDLLGGKHDMVLSPLPIISSDLTVVRLFLEPLYLVVANDHMLAKKSQIDVTDLAGLKVLAPASHYHLYDQVKVICDEVGAELLRDYEGTSLDTLRHMVGMGLGVSFLPSLYVQSEIRARGEVRAIRFKGRKITRPVGIAWRKSSGTVRGFSNIVQVMRAVAKGQFSDLRLL